MYVSYYEVIIISFKSLSTLFPTTFPQVKQRTGIIMENQQKTGLAHSSTVVTRVKGGR
jgi:hypothetical protein